MKYLVVLALVVLFLICIRVWEYLPATEQRNEATTVCVDVNLEVNVDIEHENRQNRVEVSWTTADAPGATTTEVVTSGATTDAATEATTEEPTTEATTETVTTETTTEGVPVEHYWEYSYYVESEDVVYYECCIAGCTATKSEKVPNLDVLVVETETGVRIVVNGGLYPCAELYVQYNDSRTEEIILIDTLGTKDEYNGYANIDLNQVSWLMIKSYDATSRRILAVDYAVRNGVIQK